MITCLPFNLCWHCETLPGFLKLLAAAESMYFSLGRDSKKRFIDVSSVGMDLKMAWHCGWQPVLANIKLQKNYRVPVR